MLYVSSRSWRGDRPCAMSCASCNAAAALVCSRCRGPRYCSIACQTSHWKVHKLTCNPCGSPFGSLPRSDETCPSCKLIWDKCTCTGDEKPHCWICHESAGILLCGCACRNGGGCAHVDLDDPVPIVVVSGMCMRPVSSRTTLIAIPDMPIAKYASRLTRALFSML